MIVQLNHPGQQKPFKLGNGYQQIGNYIIREWNNDNAHYRKFIQNKGVFVNGLDDAQPTQTNLYFWGEWEGNSFFEPFPKEDYKKLPNGLHKPFHSTVIRGGQNTDPYIYGDDFKYCVCKQTGQLCVLEFDDLILFGSTFPLLEKFYIDTVFVIKDFETSSTVQATGAIHYSQVYKEETLEQLNEYLKTPPHMNPNKIYNSKTWWHDKSYFSFVPCKESFKDSGFERLYINLRNPKFELSRNPTGKSFLPKCSLSSQELWKEIVKETIEQGFKLGIRFEEPIFNNCLQYTNNRNQ